MLVKRFYKKLMKRFLKQFIGSFLQKWELCDKVIFMKVCDQGKLITMVECDSPASKRGVCAGDVLLSCNGEPVLDLIDYEKLTAERNLTLLLLRDGQPYTLHVRKEEYEPLGLCFETSLMSRMQTCRNHCIFCFIDQMPKGVRTSLQVKDDDWRMSFIMGNYVTLTNVDDEEFTRILKRRVSPLFVSVHATDPEVRSRMMRNPTAGCLMDRLSALKQEGLRFHAQIVLCKGINDGEILNKTLLELASLSPALASVAVVPVGVTKYREGLYPLETFDSESSRLVIAQVTELQERFLQQYGSRLVFLSDEWYLNADLPIPDDACYEAYDQIENGVGLLRQFERAFTEGLKGYEPLLYPKTVSIAGGVAAAPFFATVYAPLRLFQIDLEMFPIPNRYFGGNVHVAGLVTGQDLVNELRGKLMTEELLIPHNMLREQEDIFLDGMTVQEAEQALGVRIRSFYDAEELLTYLFEE